MRIPDSKIDEVRGASNIVDVVSSSVKLKKRGKNYLGLCPFHQEKTPSFTVSQEKQMYHCFGCGKGGNVFTFVMDLEKVSFVEAVRTLAERAGIALPAEGEQDNQQATENEALYNACRLAGLHFYENMTGTVEGKLALEYFRHRGFSEETIRKFGLGYSMHSWDTLIKHAQSKGESIENLDKAGLVVRREDGSGYYDRFRGRGMFPIFSASGRVIGFGARKMREDDPLGKYINSPETPVYNKSRNLYGLFQAKEAIREKEYAILVEGYADLISVYQEGIENIVASSGTALTDEQILLIGRYAKNITLVYDADSAGSKAALRGVDLIIENGLDVRVAALPTGEDPDSFVKKHGGKMFQELLDKAISFLDFKAMMFKEEGLLATPEGQTRAVRSIVETIAKVKDEIKRNFYIKHLAEKYGIYESVLFRELEKIAGSAQKKRFQEKNAESEAGEQNPETSVVPTTAPPRSLPAVQRDILKLMLEHGGEMVSFVFSHIPVELMDHPRSHEVVGLILDRMEHGDDWDAGSLINDVSDEEIKRFIADLVFSKYEISKGWEKMDAMPGEVDPYDIAQRCVLLMKHQEIDRRLEDNQRRMKDAQLRGEPVAKYNQHHQELLREKKELTSGKAKSQTLNPES